jgi:hypothetical protein
MVKENRWVLPISCKLFDEPGCGLGVKTCIEFRNGCAITHYGGSVCHREDFEGCPPKCKTHLIGLGDASHRVLSGFTNPVDAMKCDVSSLGSFINHVPAGQRANCWALVVASEINMDNPDVVIVATGTLAPGTTLWLDYNKGAFYRHHGDSAAVDFTEGCTKHDCVKQN